jgi:hypothetical protein
MEQEGSTTNRKQIEGGGGESPRNKLWTMRTN